LSETGIAFAGWLGAPVETVIAFAGEKWAFLVRISVAEVTVVSMCCSGASIGDGGFIG